MVASVQAARAAAFTNSIGVNNHLGWLGTPFANLSLVEADLAYLGVSHVRDEAPVSYMVPAYETLAAEGIKFDLIITNAGTDVASALAGNLSLINELEDANPGGV